MPLIAGALAVSSPAAARATDFVAARAGFTSAVPARYAASAGVSFEANIIPDKIGVRLAGDAVFGGWYQSSHGNTLGLRPEVALFPGRDGASIRPYAAFRLQFGVLGINGASAHFVDALEFGPEVEWRQAKGNGLRLRIGTFLSGRRDAGGEFHWPSGGALAFTIEYGKPTLEAPPVPRECIELPTRPCPPRS
jgi:hypothetical protein